MNTENRILLSRLLTRSGDQAWDFAVPIVLIALFPQNPRIAFLYFFLIRLGSVVLMPHAGRLIDKLRRSDCLKLGIGLQLGSVLAAAAMVFVLSKTSGLALVPFTVLVLMGLLSTIGAGIMDIAVSNDLTPMTLPPERLPKFNARLRQLDLFTEVTSPLLAGLLLLVPHPSLAHFGFYLIVLWNVLTFYPEYMLLSRILASTPGLNQVKAVSVQTKQTFLAKLSVGWGCFARSPVALTVSAYALLWLSVLSPHGVLLTAFLSSGWQLSAPLLGAFRGLGAVFGLLATLLYPSLHQRLGLRLASQSFIVFQATALVFAFAAFLIGGEAGQLGFLALILFSRVGLYGFSLGEMELRQRLIPEHQRGEINGVAQALTGLATLVVFGLGIIFATPESFVYLVAISVSAVVLGALLFTARSTD